jgi:hypothetical protein
MHAGGVPIAVPFRCFQNVSDHLKTLLYIISARADSTCVGMILSRVLSACLVSMLVYIERASHVNKRAVGGRGHCRSFSIRSRELDR